MMSALGQGIQEKINKIRSAQSSPSPNEKEKLVTKNQRKLKR